MENLPGNPKNNTLQSPLLSHSERFYTLGLMTNRLIHEINNSIQGILLLVNFLKMNYSADETINNLDQEIQKIKNLTRSVLDYIKMNKIEFGPLDLSTVINNTITLFKDVTADPSFAVIETRYPSSIPWIKGNFFYLQQAFLNILLFCSWSLNYFQAPNMTIEVLHDSPSKMYTVRIWHPRQRAMEKSIPLAEYAEEAKLDLAQKIFHIHKGQLQFYEDNTKETTLLITLPASPPSDQTD